MNNINLKSLGHFYFFLLFIGAIVFYKERTLYMDCAYHIFNIINTKSFFVASGRYSVVIPELIPLCMVKMNAPLQIVLIAFSLSYVLLYYVIYLICVYAFKADTAIIPIMLVLSTFAVQSYFHIVTETHQGLMYSVLLFFWINHYNNSIKTKPFLFYALAFFLIVVCFFAHPVTLFPILFIFGFFLTAEWNRANKKSLLLKYGSMLVFTMCLFSARALLTPKGSYDGQFYSQLAENIHVSFFNLYPLKYASNNFNIYGLPLLIVFLLSILYLLKRDIGRFLYFFISCIALLVITQLSFGNGDSDVMMEKNFMPFAVFLGLPLLKLYTGNPSKKVQLLLLTVILVSTGLGIVNEIKYSNHMDERIGFYRKLSSFAKENGATKLIISDSCAPQNAINWGFSVETLLYSSLKGKENSMTVHINDGDTSHLKDPTIYFFVPFWRSLSEKDLNPTYFDLKNMRYVPISCSDNSFKILR